MRSRQGILGERNVVESKADKKGDECDNLNNRKKEKVAQHGRRERNMNANQEKEKMKKNKHLRREKTEVIRDGKKTNLKRKQGEERGRKK